MTRSGTTTLPSPFDASPTWMQQAASQRGRRLRRLRRAAGRAILAMSVIAVSVGAGSIAWNAMQTPRVDVWLAGIVAATATAVMSTMLNSLISRGRRRSGPIHRLTMLARRARLARGDESISFDPDAIGAGGQTAELIAALNDLLAAQRAQRAEMIADVAAKADTIRELERTIADRATQLTAANERLLGEIAEKEDFVRAISHDLNAPLRNIGGMVTLLLGKHRAALPEEIVHRLERIKTNVDVETDLINEMLEFSRIKTRRQSLHLVDVERVVWELRGLLENDLKTKNIDLIVETSLPSLFAERVRVRQVFQNLIDNAIKYMGSDRPVREIRVGCTVSVTEAEFYVRDTGMGIAREDQDRVFVIFRRGRDETSQKVAGKGVGLASVKSIIETYAGRIWVESEPGQGTTFRFTINGQYVPAVSGQVPGEMAGQATKHAPALSAAGRRDEHESDDAKAA